MVYFLFLLILLVPNASLARGAPLPNFHEVEPHAIYRGGAPNDSGLTELRDLGVRTVLSIRDENPVASHHENEKVNDLGMKFIFLPISALFEPSDATISEIEYVLADREFYPLYIHCTHGQDRTGLAIGLFRVHTEGWSSQDAYQEMIALGFHPCLFALHHYFDEHSFTP